MVYPGTFSVGFLSNMIEFEHRPHRRPNIVFPSLSVLFVGSMRILSKYFLSAGFNFSCVGSFALECLQQYLSPVWSITSGVSGESNLKSTLYALAVARRCALFI